jgi:serine/threonine protein kinase
MSQWLPPVGDGRRVALKLMLGETPDGRGTSHEAFSREADILYRLRYLTSLWANDVADGEALFPAAHAVGALNNLSFTYCTGWVENAQTVIPSAPAVPLFLIAMEPLEGGTLWDRLGVDPEGRGVVVGSPLPPDEALLVAADLMAALAALHKLGCAHADIKKVNDFASPNHAPPVSLPSACRLFIGQLPVVHYAFWCVQLAGATTSSLAARAEKRC